MKSLPIFARLDSVLHNPNGIHNMVARTVWGSGRNSASLTASLTFPNATVLGDVLRVLEETFLLQYSSVPAAYALTSPLGTQHISRCVLQLGSVCMGSAPRGTAELLYRDGIVLASYY